MPIINEDIILELTQYLEILTLLSLAHVSTILCWSISGKCNSKVESFVQSCGAAFRVSQEYSFWSPHELDASVGLATFLPDDHVGPWKSYSGNEIRRAVIEMRSFEKRWDSERVSATRRVHLGRYTSLEVIPGSRWLYNFNQGTCGVSIVDGKTGLSTIEDLVVGPVGVTWTGELPVAYSLEPNRILIGCAGENDEEIWGFALFEIILSVNENAGNHPYIEAQATQIRLWENIPEFPTIFMGPEFLVIESDETDLPGWHLHIYHISSSTHWEWQGMSDKQKPTLVDHWCVLIARQRSETVVIVAIHLPSLLSHPEVTHQNLILPEGARLTTVRGPHRRIDVLQSRNTPLRRGGSPEYTLMYYHAVRRWAFNIQLEIVPGSLYGNVILPGTESILPSDQTLKSQLSSQLSTSDGNIARPLQDGSSTPAWFTATQKGFDVLVTAFDSNNYIRILRMVDLGKGGYSRMLDWKAPLKIRAGSDAAAETDYQGDLDEIRALPAWNTRVGMLLLNGHPLPGGVQEYQTCWF